MFSVRSRLLIGAAALLAAASPAPGQEAEPFVGSVQLAGRPVPDVPVTLHRVTADSSGAIATTATDAEGSFRFRLPPPAAEGFTVFFTTAEFRGVRYFGLPLHPTDPRTGYSIAVHDTASSLPGAVRVSQRDVVLLPHADGGWEVNEVVRLVNSGDRTLVPGSAASTWEIPLPDDVEAFEAGDGDIPADRVRWMGDRLFLQSPLTPGQHEVFFRYRLAAGRSEASLNLEAGVDSLNVFVLQPSPRMEIEGMRPSDLLEVQGQRFLQFTARAVAPGTDIRMEWEGGGPAFSPVWAGVGATLLLLLVGVGAAMRGRRGAPDPAAAGAAT